MTGKRRWWPVLAIAVLICMIFCAVFWQTIRVFAAPKVALTSALTNTVSMLEERFSASPLTVLAKAFDPTGKNTFDLTVDSYDSLLGNVRYDMTVQMEQFPRRILADGDVTAQDKTLDLSMYVDGEFAAISSESLLQNNYYGLTYGSFSEDIRSNMLLRMFLGENTLREWESKISELDHFMSTSISIPAVSKEDIRGMLLGIVALKAEIEYKTLRLNGQEQRCFEISFEASGAQILDGLSYLQVDSPVSIAPDDELTVSFFLLEDTVVKMEVELDSEVSESKLTLIFGADPAVDDLRLLYQSPQGYTEITVSTEYDETNYSEVISCSQSKGNIRSDTVVSYIWGRVSGQTELEVSREEESVSLSLCLWENDEGFSLETGDFERLMYLLFGTKDTKDSHCTMIIGKGAEIHAPAYKNFDQWTMEDMTILLVNIGSLLGLKIG